MPREEFPEDDWIGNDVIDISAFEVITGDVKGPTADENGDRYQETGGGGD